MPGNKYNAAAMRRRENLRRRRNSRMRLTVILLLLMALLTAIAAFLLYVRRNRSFGRFPGSYSTVKEFGASVMDKDNPRAKPFAATLCVVDENVPREGISLPQEQQGLLFDLDHIDVMYAKDVYRRVYPASITKLVTAILALEYGNLDDIVTIREEDLDLEEGSQICGFWAGDQLSMNQLLHCLLVYSGNDAAMAIADHVGGSVPAFVDMMNQYARDLGCTGTHFTNPHGLQDPDHYTTPYDIYLLLKEAAKYPSFTEISQMGSYTVEYTRVDGVEMKTRLEATDHYLTGEATLPKNVSVLGGKTGTTNEAGNCLALLTQNAYGQPFVSIIMGAWDKELLYEQMNTMLMQINTV